MTCTTRGPSSVFTISNVCSICRDVVPVDRPEIAEAQLLEQHPGRPEVLDALFDVLGEVDELRCRRRCGRRVSITCLTLSRIRTVIGLATMEPRYLLIAPTLGAIDMPLSLRTTMMSRPRSRRRCSAPRTADRTSCAPSPTTATTSNVLALQVAGGRHAERRRQRRARMPGAELIVLALVAPQEARQAALLRGAWATGRCGR